MGGTAILSPSSREALERFIEEELLRRAVEQKVVSTREEAVVRDLLPSDLNGVSGETWVEWCSAGSYNTVFSGQMLNPDRLMVFYGMGDIYLDNVSAAIAKSGGANIPPGKTIKFGLGAGPAVIKDIWDLGRIRTNPNRREIFTTKPLWYNKGDKFTIQIRGDGTAGAVDHVVLYGKMCEPKGTTITPG